MKLYLCFKLVARLALVLDHFPNLANLRSFSHELALSFSAMMSDFF